MNSKDSNIKCYSMTQAVINFLEDCYLKGKKKYGIAYCQKCTVLTRLNMPSPSLAPD